MSTWSTNQPISKHRLVDPVWIENGPMDGEDNPRVIAMLRGPGTERRTENTCSEEWQFWHTCHSPAQTTQVLSFFFRLAESCCGGGHEATSGVMRPET